MPFKRLTMAVDRWVVGVNVVFRSKKFCHFAEMNNVKSTVNFQLLANSGGMQTFSVLAEFKLPCNKTLTVSGKSHGHK